jgi:D-alanyl-D-alanine carboxypeptidase
MRRRRSRRPLGVALALVFAVGAGGGAALYDATDEGGGGGSRGTPPAAAVVQPPAKLRPPPELRDELQPKPPPGIELPTENLVAVRFKRPPRAGLLLDLDTGRVLWARRPLEVLPIASLTKIMTALIVVERTEAGDRARISRNAVRFRGSGVGVLPRGKRVPVEALMYGMLLPSGNDAATALAEHVAGSDRRFARLATRRAHDLGLGCTRFVSSFGLESGNRSCAADLAALARLAMRQPRIARIVRQAHARLRFPIKGRYLDVSTTNPLLKDGYPGTIGLKTGFTNRAGHCLVAVVRRGGHTLAAVLLHSPDTDRQARRLIGAGFRAVGG